MGHADVRIMNEGGEANRVMLQKLQYRSLSSTSTKSPSETCDRSMAEQISGKVFPSHPYSTLVLAGGFIPKSAWPP